jgi:predicted RNA binding protein YcfA (HicA-like mRNA interferase family)
MPKPIRPYSYRKVAKALGKIGFQMDRQRGSHMIFKGFTNGRERTVVVPKHGEIAVGTLMSIWGKQG